MLGDKKLKAFIPTVDPERAKKFYTVVLGLKLISEDDYGMEFYANGTLLRISTVQQFIPYPFTVLGWDVENISSIIAALAKTGVVFERYNYIEQDYLGIWVAPGETKVAWFKDPDGNIISLTENIKPSTTSAEEN